MRTALKEDVGCSSAELVYGTTLCLPGEFFDHKAALLTSNPATYNYMSKIRAQLPRTQAPRKAHINSELATTTHVFVRHDPTRGPLQSPYDGDHSRY